MSQHLNRPTCFFSLPGSSIALLEHFEQNTFPQYLQWLQISSLFLSYCFLFTMENTEWQLWQFVIKVESIHSLGWNPLTTNCCTVFTRSRSNPWMSFRLSSDNSKHHDTISNLAFRHVWSMKSFSIIQVPYPYQLGKSSLYEI